MRFNQVGLKLLVALILTTVSVSASPGNLAGLWDYTPLGNKYVLELKDQGNGVYTGRYIVPSSNNSTFKFRAYPGRAAGVLVEMVQSDGSYHLIFNGLMTDRDTIQGIYIDVDGNHNQVMMKRR